MQSIVGWVEEARLATFAHCMGTHAHWHGWLMTYMYVLYTKFELTCLSGLWCFDWGALLFLYCICDSSPASWAASVAQLVRAIASGRSWVQIPPEAVYFFEKYLPWVSCVVLLCLSVVLRCLLSEHFISHVHVYYTNRVGIEFASKGSSRSPQWKSKNLEWKFGQGNLVREISPFPPTPVGNSVHLVWMVWGSRDSSR